MKRERSQIRGELFPCPALAHPYNRESRHEFLCGGFVLLQQIFDQKALDLPPPPPPPLKGGDWLLQLHQSHTSALFPADFRTQLKTLQKGKVIDLPGSLRQEA